jgi:cytosine/uracil/thiamine/allantoin permease
MFCPLLGCPGRLFSLEEETDRRISTRKSRYWFYRGVNLKAIVAWTIGFIIYLGFSPMLMEKVLGIRAGFPWPLGSSLPSMVLAGLVYGLVRRK